MIPISLYVENKYKTVFDCQQLMSNFVESGLGAERTVLLQTIS